MISESLCNSVISSLTEPSFRKGRWEEVMAEIHDGGQFLFLMIEARDYSPDEMPLEIKREMSERILSTLASVGQANAKWSVAISSRGRHYDGFYPDDF